MGMVTELGFGEDFVGVGGEAVLYWELLDCDRDGVWRPLC